MRPTLPPDDREPLDAGARRAPQATWRPGRALVVEDVSFLRRSLATLLAADGLDCDEASSVEAALEALGAPGAEHRNAYDVVLLDLGLGERSGLEVLAAMRARPELDATPVILVTAQACEPRDVASGLLAGAHDYVTRPFAPEVLRARVASARRARERMVQAEARRRDADRRADDAQEELAAHACVKRASVQPMPRREGSFVVNAASLLASSAVGDYFHVGHDAAGRTLAILVDAAGHGAAASAMATLAGRAARDALREDPDLEGAYHAVTATLMAHELPRATAALALVRVGDGVVELLNAGLPPIGVIDEGVLRFVESVAPPAGVGFLDVGARIVRCAVSPGFAVALATDGALGGAQDVAAMEELAARFGLERCAASLAKADPLLLATLLREHAARPGQPPDDDATFVVLAHAPVTGAAIDSAARGGRAAW